MRIGLSVGKALRHRGSYLSLVRLCPPISSASVGDISKLVVKIPSMYEILMGYWTEIHIGTMMSSVIYNSKLIMSK